MEGSVEVCVGSLGEADRTRLRLLCVIWDRCFSHVRLSYRASIFVPPVTQGLHGDKQDIKRGHSICLLTLQGDKSLSILQARKMRLRYYRLAPIYLPPKTSAQRKNKHSPGKKSDTDKEGPYSQTRNVGPQRKQDSGCVQRHLWDRFIALVLRLTQTKV